MSNGSLPSRDLISAFHDGELAGHDLQAAEQLLEESADSRAELEDYRALSELLRELPAVSPPEGLRAAVMRRIEQASSAPPVQSATPTRPRRRWRFRVGLVVTMLTAAAALLVMLVRPDRVKNEVLVADAEDGASAAPAMPELEAISATRGLAEEAADTPTTSGSLDALAGSGGVAAAGAAARPPDGFSIGDVYTYLEQTPDGDVMVVKAVVVDVRRAVDQLQVLLSKSEIPTISVAANDESFGASSGAAPSRMFFADPRQEVALYVESDPGRMIAALESLGGEDEFLSWQYAGVLDESQPAAQLSALSYYGKVPAPGIVAAEADDSSPGLERERMAPREPRAAARGSVTDRAFRRAEESVEAGEILPQSTGRELPLRQQTESAGLDKGAVEERWEDAKRVDIKNGYQAVLNLPRAELEQQLTVSKATPQEAKSPMTRYYDRLGETAASERDATLADETKSRQTSQNAQVQANQLGKAAVQSQQQRRLRLLVVLEPEPEPEPAAAKAVKAKADPQPEAPVEAAPPARKKG